MLLAILTGLSLTTSDCMSGRKPKTLEGMLPDMFMSAQHHMCTVSMLRSHQVECMVGHWDLIVSLMTDYISIKVMPAELSMMGIKVGAGLNQARWAV